MKNNAFDSAKKDLYLLLNRNYPKSYALRFVGDHYGLKNEQRYILSRSVFSKSYIDNTRKKKLNLKDIKGKSIFIDGYNVIITTESVLMGKAFVSMDGLIRDTRNVSKKHKITKDTLESIECILDLLEKYPPESTQVYLDKMMSKSGKISEIIRDGLEERNLRGDSETVSNVDYTLKNSLGIIATNDSAIISEIKEFIDLPSKVKISRGT
ncbi:MAG: hypothetical protein APG12_00125 [Candidatus Methanofastidiosum methylothiophilum]|uniref:DUF434 domain-containing protein n=1 Tax=Candidatus Methanofastidiosum methylothiophilum TaxID=1705564 RepID=A0A150IQ62_9EURY|nr:MAG: hypothetical protein APG10_00833 [Candidatus Methanofastidiosum methylthiophilus]KYC47196.1 MAG: hypothetical protein APG11_01352 [Candidatus Methanofastidiosum methylthiophilus]KYC51461.1 MAG: hypothetical protein APG12_00125 [Candidatus Methanofastidiosum methylthiophilus]